MITLQSSAFSRFPTMLKLNEPLVGVNLTILGLEI